MAQSFKDEDVARFWDLNSPHWAAHVRKRWDIYREKFNNPQFLAFAGDLNNKLVLDAGCGEGHNTRILAGRGAKVVGVDISNNQIELAREEERREPLGIRFESASFSDLGIFSDSSFDAVVSTMALMDCVDYPAAIREFFRILKPGGAIVFSTLHPCFMTRDFGWVGSEEAPKLQVGGYFTGSAWIDRWKFSYAEAQGDMSAPPFEIPRFARTLSEYINSLIAAGFLIREIAEPRPSEEVCREFPRFRRWRDLAALFLYIKASKP